MVTANEKRRAVVAKYKTIIGRNKYSQAKRGYAFEKYSDGKYYSDCSSSIALAYKYAGYPFYDNSGSYNPNTVGMYQSKNLVDVPVKIKNGIIQNPEILQLGDMLLFAGTDNSRRYADCVGHVEMVGKIENGKVTLYGHGSGTPRAIEMNSYCRSRYSKKASTVIGNRGLLKVRRFIVDDDNDTEKEIVTGSAIEVKNGCNVHVRTGPSKNYKSLTTAKSGDKFPLLDTNGWIPVCHNTMILWISSIYVKSNVDGIATITGGTVNMRSGPGKKYSSIRYAKRGEIYTLVNSNGWYPIEYGGIACWITNKYTKKIK